MYKIKNKHELIHLEHIARLIVEQDIVHSKESERTTSFAWPMFLMSE